MDGRCFLATFRPLIHSPGGRDAARRYGLPPFIDGSCRREPDSGIAVPVNHRNVSRRKSSRRVSL